MSSRDEEIVSLLKDIKKALAPDFSELDAETQKGVFANTLSRASLAEVFDLEENDPYLRSLSQQKENQEKAAQTARARAVGARENTMVEDIITQLDEYKGKLTRGKQ